MMFISQKSGYYTSQLDSLLRISRGPHQPLAAQDVGKHQLSQVWENSGFCGSRTEIPAPLHIRCQQWIIESFPGLESL